MDSIRAQLNFDNCLTVDSLCIALLWQNQIDLQVTSYSRYHIDSFVNFNCSSSSSWKLICFYGEPQAYLRPRLCKFFQIKPKSRFSSMGVYQGP